MERPTSKICPGCGREFTIMRSRYSQIYCNRACSIKTRPSHVGTPKTPIPPIYDQGTDTYRLSLGHGYQTIIDACDIDLAVHKWHISAKPPQRVMYAHRKMGDRKNNVTVRLHRIVLSRIIGRELKKGELTDHINGDGLDNRRSNLRIASHAENIRNRSTPSNNKTGYKGVQLERSGRYSAKITVDWKQICLGRFDTAELASAAYIAASLKYFGAFARIEPAKEDQPTAAGMEAAR